MVLADMPPGARYAAVEVDAGGSVRRIAGRFGPGGEGLAPRHFTGVHVVSPALLDEVPAEPFELDVNRHVYPRLMERGLVRALAGRGYWNDLGTPARYLAANEDVLAGRVPLHRFGGADPFDALEPFAEPGVWMAHGAHIDPGAALHPPTLVGAGARIEAGATVGPGAVVGAGARVAAGARVVRAVVWDGTALAACEDVRDAIAAGTDRVPAREA
jgi:mannose-1-phosphate guanylyltransferase